MWIVAIIGAIILIMTAFEIFIGQTLWLYDYWYEVDRDDEPFLFWLGIIVQTVLGLAMIVYGLSGSKGAAGIIEGILDLIG